MLETLADRISREGLTRRHEMGRLATKLDPRLEVGAYVSCGTALYRIVYSHDGMTAMEDAMSSEMRGYAIRNVQARDVIRLYTLIRAA